MGALTIGLQTAAPTTPANGLTIYADSTTNQLDVMNSSGAVYTIGQTSPYKNKLVNPRFDYWQAGTSSTTSGYLPDQWYCQVTTGSITFSQTSLNGLYALTATTSAATSHGEIFQPLEQAEVIPLRGKTMTYSIYMQCNASFTGNVNLGVWYSNSTDARASDSNLVSFVSVTPTTTLTRYSLTFTVPSDAVGFEVGVNSGTNQATIGAAITYSSAQLEIGIAPTQFECFPYAMEQIRCQRFLLVYGGVTNYDIVALGQCISTTQANVTVWMPVTMRTSPSLSLSSLTHWEITNASAGGVLISALASGVSTPKTVLIVATATAANLVAGNVTHLLAYNTTSARLYLDARL